MAWMMVRYNPRDPEAYDRERLKFVAHRLGTLHPNVSPRYVDSAIRAWRRSSMYNKRPYMRWFIWWER